LKFASITSSAPGLTDQKMLKKTILNEKNTKM